MYIPKLFEETRLDVLHAAMRQSRLAVLVTTGAEGIEASHLPLMLDPAAGPNGTLYGHLAKANPQWHRFDAGKPALVIFSGPDAYVSPSWYPTKAETHRVVPTWNYVAIHAYGTLSVHTQPGELRDLVSRLTAIHEGREAERARATPWAVDDAPEDFVQAQLKGIVGISLPIDQLEGKFKMSQNRPAGDRAGVVSALESSESAVDRDVAALIPR